MFSTYPDTLLIGSAIPPDLIAADRFVMCHRAVSLRHGLVVADSASVLVSFDYQKRVKAPLPSLLSTEFRLFMDTHVRRAATAAGATDPYALARTLVSSANA